MSSANNTRTNPHWEKLFGRSWVHPLFGEIRCLRGKGLYKGHPYEEFWVIPEDSPAKKFGPFLTAREAKLGAEKRYYETQNCGNPNVERISTNSESLQIGA